MQIGKCFLKLIVGSQVEATCHRHVADSRSDHVSLGNRRQWYGITRNGDGLFLSRDVVQHGNFHDRAAWSQQELANFGITLVLHGLAVDFEDAITEAQSRACRWRVVERGANKGIDLITLLHVIDRGADSEIFGTLLGLESREVNRIEIGGVRIKDLEHARDRRFEYGIVIKLAAVNVVSLNHREGFIQVSLDDSRSHGGLVPRGIAGRTIARAGLTAS